MKSESQRIPGVIHQCSFPISLVFNYQDGFAITARCHRLTSFDGLWSMKHQVLQLVVPQDEALELWGEEWGKIYEEGSDSRKLLKSIEDTWLLVSLVENDYVNGDLFGVFQLPKKANGNHA
jgi:hypothetical protein